MKIYTTISGLLLLMLPAAAPSHGATASAGCGKALATGIYTMNDQGVTRTYRVLVPSGYKPTTPSPLVLVFHGWGGNENEFLNDATVKALSEGRGYIIVAPRGLGSGSPDNSNNSWSFRGSTTGLDATSKGGVICDPAATPNYAYPSCKDAKIALNTCSWTQCQADDVAFTVALVKLIESNACVDTTRVFATGGSNGGMFTWELGQNPLTAKTFRAIAPLIGLPHRGYLDPPGKTPLPVLLVTGTQDPTVPAGPWEDTSYTTTGGGDTYYYTGASAITRAWGEANACPYLNAPATSFNSGTNQAVCRTYCGSNAAGWSGGVAFKGWPNVLDCRAPMGHTFDLTWSWNLILDFFDGHSS